MNRTMQRIAAILAFIIGAMAVVAGGQVLLGKVPGYYVINWLPAYNFTMGMLAVFIIAPLIWTNNPYSKLAAIGTFGAHTIVMLILQTSYRGVVAPDSIIAMSIRLIVWLIILILMFFQSRKDRLAS